MLCSRAPSLLRKLIISTWNLVKGGRYHRVLQQVLQFAQSAVPVTGVLSLDGFLELAQVRLAVPSIAHELTRETRIFDVMPLRGPVEDGEEE